jgi:hypothetical protein
MRERPRVVTMGTMSEPGVVTDRGRERPGRAGRRNIRDMTGDATSARPGESLPGWARWVALAVFAAFVGIGLGRLNPSPPAAAGAAVVTPAPPRGSS